MESSSDDGDPATTHRVKALLLLCLLFFSCTGPVKEAARPAPRPVKLPEASAPKKSPAPRKKKKLYLTFDDGPNRGTRKVLHMVQEEEVAVSFFVIGEHVFASRSQKEDWDSLQAARGVALCNHSYTHAWNNRYGPFYEHPDSVVRDCGRAHDSLGLTNDIVRTPGRNIWRIDSLYATDLKKSTAAADSLQEAGFRVMGWDLEWKYDHRTMKVTASAGELLAQVDSLFAQNRTMLPDHLVLLAHDGVYETGDDSAQLRQLLQLLKVKNEYELSLVTGYPGAGRTARDSFPARRQP